jgi:hypothetical protein
MLSDLKTEVHKALFVHSGEILTTGNGESPRLLLFLASSSFSLPSIPSQPSVLRSTTRIRTYPFAGPFAKETPTFLIFMPAILGRNSKSDFL